MEPAFSGLCLVPLALSHSLGNATRGSGESPEDPLSGPVDQGRGPPAPSPLDEPDHTACENLACGHASLSSRCKTHIRVFPQQMTSWRSQRMQPGRSAEALGCLCGTVVKPPPNMWSREGFRCASEGWRVIQNNTLFPVYAAFNAGFHPDVSRQSRCGRGEGYMCEYAFGRKESVCWTAQIWDPLTAGLPPGRWGGLLQRKLTKRIFTF